MLDFETVSSRFESHSEHFYIDLFNGSPEISNPSAALVNSQGNWFASYQFEFLTMFNVSLAILVSVV